MTNKKPFVFILSLLFVVSSCARSSTITPAMKAPDLIAPQVAQALKPYIPPVATVRGTITHEVAPMESLWRISKMYDVHQQDIIRTNSLKNPNDIKTGQKLTIPNAAPLQSFIPLYPNNRWTHIVIHHTASDIGSAMLVDKWHKNRGFWNGLGYHFLIDNGTVGKQNGQIEIAPRWIKQQRGAHCKAGNMNTKSIGVSLVGNFSKDQPTQDQMDSLVFLIKQLMDYYAIPSSNIIGHRDACGANTECPGTKFPWAEFKRKIK